MTANTIISQETLNGLPHVTLALGKEGLLVMILPDGRSLDLKSNPLASIYTVLMAQMQGAVSMSQDGAPTRQQIYHWEQHHTVPDSRCAFCRKEKRIKGTRSDYYVAPDVAKVARQFVKDAETGALPLSAF